MSIGIFNAYDRIVTDFGESLPASIRKNLDALCEIRDNSIHFINDAPDTEKRVNEIGSASVKNYLNLTRQWFGVDFSKYNLSLLPIAFMRSFRKAGGISLSNEEQKFNDYITKLSAVDDDVDADFNVALHIEVQMKRTKDAQAPSALSFQARQHPLVIIVTMKQRLPRVAASHHMVNRA